MSARLQFRLLFASALLALTLVPSLAGWAEHPVALLWPPLLALTVILVTRMAALGLLVAGLAGCLLLAGGNPWEMLTAWAGTHLWQSLLGDWHPSHGFSRFWKEIHLWHLGALLFTILLGAFASVLERGGGLQRFLLSGAAGSADRPRRFLLSVYGLGLLCFFDGLANSLMVGRVSLGLGDRLRIPRAALAYVVDTTSSAVACVAVVSTWIAMQLTLIADGSASLGLETSSYLLFLSSIPRNYYCLFALALAFLVCLRGWWIGPMRRSKPQDRGGGEATSRDVTCARWRAFLPLAVLLPAILVFYYLLHPLFASPEEMPGPRLPLTLAKVQAALGSNAGPAAFVLGSLTALAVAAASYPRERWRELPRTAGRGAVQMLAPLGILVLAWVFGSVLKEQGTAAVLARGLGQAVPLPLYPATVFLAACAIAFISGTSWGTMGLLMPLALPALGPMAAGSPDMIPHLAPAVIAAVFGGAVFGDHCSPFSDTTIVSAIACGITTPEHTVTQLPYALLTAATALLSGYGLEATGLPPFAGLLAGFTVLVLLTRFRPSPRPEPAPPPSPRQS